MTAGGSRRGRARRRRACAVIAPVFLLLGLAGPAQAGVYTVHACQDPSGAGAVLDGWSEIVHGGHGAVYDDCWPGGRGSFGGSLPQDVSHRPGEGVEWAFASPPGTAIRGYRIWRSVQIASPSSSGYAYLLTESSTILPTVVETCAASLGCTSRGDRSRPLAGENAITRGGLSGVRRLSLALHCGASPECPATSGSPAAGLQIHRADIALDDPAAPMFLSRPTGALVDANRTLSGSQGVALTAIDGGGGVYKAIVEVDGRVMDSVTLDPNGGRCREPFTSAVPCKPVAGGTVTFDTARLADRAHRLRLLVTDATGTNQAAFGPVTIRTANGNAGAVPAPGSSRGEPAPGRTCATRPSSQAIVLRASFGRGRRRATIGFGGRARVRGRLGNRKGDPLANAAVCVMTRDAAVGARWRVHGRIRTDAHGRFRFRTRGGPSRLIRFVHRGGDGAGVAQVRLRVRAGVSLRLSGDRLRGGQPLALLGRLRGGPIPRSGLFVEVQARRGSDWQTFRMARSNRRGWFLVRHRFTRRPGLRIFRLRVRVRQQPSYPYATGASRAVTVRVSG